MDAAVGKLLKKFSRGICVGVGGNDFRSSLTAIDGG
jgi:hypothetical protein